MRLAPLLSACALLAACTPEVGPELTVEENLATPAETGKGGGTALSVDPTVQPNATGIGYNGGPVMLGTPDVYYIWYGNWSGNSATTILPDFMANLGGSPYFLINTTYYDSAGRHVTGSVNYAGAVSDNYSQGKALSDARVQAIVSRAITSGALPSNANAVYFVLTSSDVTLSGFCNGFCGWHTHATIGGRDIKYSFVGNPEQCPRSCAPYANPGPNGNTGADGMASILAHELEETVTDPDLNAWTDSAGENADKCAWKFGTTYAASNGGTANMRLGARDYLIQQNLDASNGKCETKLPGTPPPPPPPSDGPKVTVLGPSAGTIIHAGGPLDITASVTDPVAVSSVTVSWVAPSGTTQFTTTKNAAGNWELTTTLSTSAQAGTRSFTVTARDANNKTATSPSVTLTVQ